MPYKPASPDSLPAELGTPDGTMRIPDLEYRVREIDLTLEQAVRFNPPSTPLKDTEKRKDRWMERFGRAQTEIDALMALAPGALEDAVHAAFAPYCDDTLADRAAEIHAHWVADSQARLDARIGEDRVEDWRARFEAAVEEIRTVHAEQNEAARGLSLTVPELTEADPGDETDDGDVASSSMTLSDESVSLRARKAFEDGDSGDGPDL
jgi:hypothetical protein